MHRWMLSAAALLASTSALAAPRASTELTDTDGDKHTASMAFDGLLSTAWAEDEDGAADGSWLELPFRTPVEITMVSVWPGNLSKGKRSLREYGRPRTVTVTLFTAGGEEVQEEVRFQDAGKVGPRRIDIPIEGKARSLKITIDDAYEGGVFTDVYVAEVAVNFKEGTSPKVVERLAAWQESDSGQRAKATNDNEVKALFKKIAAEEFGDRDALAAIMDRAGDGAPYLRGRVAKLVPDGYRVQALPPDSMAIEALLKLKDANGIPAIEMAALRTSGKRSKQLANRVEYFYAYQELHSGGNHNIPFWGSPGWEPGALRSFDEPINLEVDRFGEVYVADVGNHRVQRYGQDGDMNRVWGAKPAVSSTWFNGRRPYYVAGSAPGDSANQFTNPVDIVLIPGKDQDGFAVLDSTGRVQIFNEEGMATIGWKLRTDDEISPGVGGEGYLLHTKGRVIVVWGNEVFVYSLDSEELSHFKIEDGTPNGAETMPNGKLAFIVGRELIMYSTDGYRHGRLLKEEDLGVGVEDWDVSLDEKGKLWAVTDTGWAIKYKKPGKEDYRVQISEIDLIRPRFAVLEDMLWVVDRDRILEIDALKVKRQKELELEEAKKAAAESKG